MQIITRPLLSWSRPVTTDRKGSPYRTDYNRTLNLLEKEIELLGGTGEIVMQVDIPENKIRRDGCPAADAVARSPRVAVSFTSKKYGAMVYMCDRFNDWQGNVRAIALGLERLRLVEQTGITNRGEQYTGFKRLGSGIEMPAAAMTVEEASRELVLLSVGDHVTITREAVAVFITAVDSFRTIYRTLASRLHPDACGGSRTRWDRLQAAADVLKKHHGIS